MNKEILDFDHYSDPSKNSKYSCYYGLGSILLLLIMFFLTILKITYRIDLSIHSLIFPILTLALLMIGVKGIQHAFKSLKQKEPINFFKGFGIFINLIVLLLIIFVLLSYFVNMGILFGY